MHLCKLLICVLLCSCFSSSPPPVTLLLDWVPNPNHAPLFVGEKLGFFQEEGISLQILKLLDPPSAIPYLKTGKADIVLYYMPYALIALEKEQDLAALGVLIDQPLEGVLSLQPGPIGVMGVYPGVRTKRYLDAVFSEDQSFFQSMKKVSQDPNICLVTKEVDGITGVYGNIEPFQLQAAGYASFFHPLKDWGVPSYYELIFLCKESFVDAEFAKAFRRALQKSIDFCRAHPEEAFALYRASEATSRKLWEKDAWEATLPLFAQSQEWDRQKTEDFVHFLEAKKVVIPGSIDLDRFLQSYVVPTTS